MYNDDRSIYAVQKASLALLQYRMLKTMWRGGCISETSEKQVVALRAHDKSTITAIILLILRSFQRKGLCNSGLKAKSTTFAYNNK